jgi:hypothetical protein
MEDLLLGGQSQRKREAGRAFACKTGASARQRVDVGNRFPCFRQRLFTLGENSPCVTSGRVVAAELGRPGLEAAFVRMAGGRRGLIAVVEHGGRIRAGQRAEVRVPRPVKRAF